MSANPSEAKPGYLSELLSSEKQLVERLIRVFRFDASVYAEIERDFHAIPQAIVVVMVTAVLFGLGQGSVPGALFGVAGGIIVWLVVSALVWAVGLLFTGQPADYTRLLRGLGFAFAWNAVQLGSSLPLVGGLFRWGGVLCWAVSLVIATRQGLELSTARATLICLIALCTPFVLLWLGG